MINTVITYTVIGWPCHAFWAPCMYPGTCYPRGHGVQGVILGMPEKKSAGVGRLFTLRMLGFHDIEDPITS